MNGQTRSISGRLSSGESARESAVQGHGTPAAGASGKEVSWETLDRMDWHLWILAMLLIFLLGASLLSFMFPSAFWFGEDMAATSPQRAFFGFCVLLGLVLVYLLQRQAAVRRLKGQLYAMQVAMAATEREAMQQAFSDLPGIGQFRDALAMEYRRASTSGSRLAVAVFTLSKASPEILGRLTNRLRLMIREGESLCRFSEKALGVILPSVGSAGAASFATQVRKILGDDTTEMEAIVSAYPEEAASLAELERRLLGRGK